MNQDNDQPPKSGDEGKRVIRDLLSRRRQALEAAKARNREDAIRRATEQRELERLLREEEARVRRRASQARQDEDRRLRAALGRIVLAKLQSTGSTTVSFDQIDWALLPAAQAQHLVQVLAERVSAPAPVQAPQH